MLGYLWYSEVDGDHTQSLGENHAYKYKGIEGCFTGSFERRKIPANNKKDVQIMPFDLVGWYESQDASAGALVSAVDIGESIYRTKDDDIYIKERAPWLGGIGIFSHSDGEYIEVRQPSLKIPYRFGRTCVLDNDIFSDGYYHMWDRPLPLYTGEKANIYCVNASTEITMIIAWLLSGKCLRSDIERANPTHIIRGESDTAAVADAWTNIKTITWSHDLPKGRYAIVGMTGCTQLAATGEKLAALRLVLPDNNWRPGVMLSLSRADKSQWRYLGYRWDLGQLWPLMPEISFPHDQMPTAEILSSAVNDNHVIELLLQKIG